MKKKRRKKKSNLNKIKERKKVNKESTSFSYSLFVPLLQLDYIKQSYINHTNNP